MALLLLVTNWIFLFFAICFLVCWNYCFSLSCSWWSSTSCFDIYNFYIWSWRDQNIAKDINLLSLYDAEKWWTSSPVKLNMCARKHLSPVTYNLSARAISSIPGLFDSFVNYITIMIDTKDYKMLDQFPIRKIVH